MLSLLVNREIPAFTKTIVIPKKTRMTREEFGKNSTDKADKRYLDALKNGPLTVKQISALIGRNVASVQKRVRVMEKNGLIKHCGTLKTKANPPILWGLK